MSQVLHERSRSGCSRMLSHTLHWPAQFKYVTGMEKVSVLELLLDRRGLSCQFLDFYSISASTRRRCSSSCGCVLDGSRTCPNVQKGSHIRHPSRNHELDLFLSQARLFCHCLPVIDARLLQSTESRLVAFSGPRQCSRTSYSPSLDLGYHERHHTHSRTTDEIGVGVK